jgi:hypothetical protein
MDGGYIFSQRFDPSISNWKRLEIERNIIQVIEEEWKSTQQIIRRWMLYPFLLKRWRFLGKMGETTFVRGAQ